MNITAQQLLQSLQGDPTLNPAQKAEVTQFVKHPGFLSQLSGGVFGAGLALLLSKFLNMSPRAQLLMTLAGYGVGKMLLDASHKHGEKFIQYNQQMRLYDINDK